MYTNIYMYISSGIFDACYFCKCTAQTHTECTHIIQIYTAAVWFIALTKSVFRLSVLFRFHGETEKKERILLFKNNSKCVRSSVAVFVLNL